LQITQHFPDTFMMLLQLVPWTRGKTLAVSAGVLVIIIAFLFVFRRPAPYVYKDIPIPFLSRTGEFQGAVTYVGKRNGINVYDVTFRNAERNETLLPDRIYLVHIPNDSGFQEGAFDLVMKTVGTGDPNVDYYGYRYSDAAATLERRDISAVRFADRFPWQFFASAKARQIDVQHENALANFETANGIRFRPTSNAPDGVRVDPLGALYVIVVNETNGAVITPLIAQGCGNGSIEGAEQCDDGNTDDTDGCHNDCTFGFPIPFGGSGGTNTGAKLAVNVRSITDTHTAVRGEPNITLLKFDASAADEPILLQKMVFLASAGSLTTVTNYRLWQDGNGDGIVDFPIGQPVSPAGNTVTFEGPSAWTGAVIGTGRTMLFEVRADVPQVSIGTALQIALDTSNSSYVAARRSAGSFSLVGIRTNGTCTTTPRCQIIVTTNPGILWTFPLCGNRIIESGETCDDNNTTPGDGCSDTCAVESGWACTGEPSVCTQPVCGNGVVETGEICDDSDTTSGDGCSATCTVESGYTCTGTPSVCTQNTVCGNGVVETGEICDDSDTTSGDGCSATCTVESGYTCTGTPSVCTQNTVCGNGVLDTGEECDNGTQNGTPGNDCDSSCHLTTPIPEI